MATKRVCNIVMVDDWTSRYGQTPVCIPDWRSVECPSDFHRVTQAILAMTDVDAHLWDLYSLGMPRHSPISSPRYTRLCCRSLLCGEGLFYLSIYWNHQFHLKRTVTTASDTCRLPLRLSWGMLPTGFCWIAHVSVAAPFLLVVVITYQIVVFMLILHVTCLS